LLLVLMLSPLPDTLTPMMSVLISLLVTMRSAIRSRAALQLEVLALQHQLRVLDRSRLGRVRLTRVDRVMSHARTSACYATDR